MTPITSVVARFLSRPDRASTGFERSSTSLCDSAFRLSSRSRSKAILRAGETLKLLAQSFVRTGSRAAQKVRHGHSLLPFQLKLEQFQTSRRSSGHEEPVPFDHQFPERSVH